MKMQDKNPMDWSPGDCLRDAANLADEIDADASLTLIHINRDGKFATEMRVSGLTISQTVALLEIQKHRLLKLMDCDNNLSHLATLSSKPTLKNALKKLRNTIDSLIDKTGPDIPTTTDDLVLRESPGRRYVDVITEERTAELVADEAGQTQLSID